MRDTKIINLFGGPGSRKSTWRAGLFWMFRRAGLDCEEVHEWIKTPVWEGRKFIFDQPAYVYAKQMAAMERVIGKVDVIVTDSPFSLSAFYGSRNIDLPYSDLTYEAMMIEFKRIGGTNVFLNRTGQYNPAGRLQTEWEARQVDLDLHDFLTSWGVSFDSFDADDDDTIIRHCFGSVGRPLVDGSVFHLPHFELQKVV